MRTDRYAKAKENHINSFKFRHGGFDWRLMTIPICVLYQRFTVDVDNSHYSYNDVYLFGLRIARLTSYK